MNHPNRGDIKAVEQAKIHQLNFPIFDQCKIELIDFGSH